MNSSNHNMSAVIIDDHPFARLALKTFLENQNIVVTGEAADDFHAIQLVDRLQPDIVIVDVMLIGSSGIDVVTKLRQNHYAGSIVMVSGKNQIFYRKCSVDAGANAFISKKESMDNFVAAIQAVQRGYYYFPLPSYNPTPAENKILSLSEQEIKIMRYILSGAPNQNIAAEMNINPKTVSTYKRRLMGKLNCKTLKDLFVFSNNNNIG